jgi:tRNA modification GTPase
MNNYKKDNIVAIATANGQAGVGIIRISGINLLPLITKLTTIKSIDKIKPRYAHYVDFINCNDNSKDSNSNKDDNSKINQLNKLDELSEVIDSGVLLYFPTPHSFTGEDVIEIQGHGSPIILQMLIKSCLNLGCRLAEAGEFSKRAYLNGKIDLLQAESILDLIHAESEAAAKGAVKSLRGIFSKHINQINEQLINLRMFIEATLDFPEEDIEFIANAKIKDKLINLQSTLQILLNSTKCGVLLNNGINIVIIGRPNVGKSSLLNALANEDIAIVTDIAGTTRDIVREKIIINGIVCNIIDTAGIRSTTDVVENIGIKRAFNAIQTAQLCLVLIDETIGITEDDNKILAQIPAEIPRIFVHNKIDLTDFVGNEAGIDRQHIAHIQQQEYYQQQHVYISAKHQLGLDILRNVILDMIGFNMTSESYNSSDIFTARTRHLDAVNRTISHIDTALLNWQQLEIAAEELRYGHNSLSEITGEFTADDLLGEIFSKFCIGK